MHYVSRTIKAAAIVVSAFVPSALQALGGSPIVQSNIAPGGVALGCDFQAFSDPDGSQGFAQSADVTIFVGGMDIVAAGGNSYFFNNPDSFGYRSITVADIETCAALQPGSVTIVSQNGADAANYGADDYMGIVFTAIPAGDTQTYRYEIALSGATNTSLIATRTLISLTTFYRDADGDGYGTAAITTEAVSAPSGYVTNDSDCNDSDGAINPGAVEILDSFDNDCDGEVDEGLANTPPTAVAGAIPNPAASGQTVSLVGTSSSANDSGQSLTYSWTQTAGTTVTLSPNASAANPSFVAPSLTPGGPNETLTFSLVVNDGVENSVADTVDVTVNAPSAPSDTTPPVFTTVSADIIVSTDAGQATAVVTFPAATAVDDTDPNPSVYQVVGPSSGSAFPVGTTTVTYAAVDASGNASNVSFTVTVNDEEPPVVTVPADITQTASSGQATQVVNFTVSAVDNVDGATTATANPPSGTAFPVGTTTVTVTATDAAANTGTSSFTVTVNDATAPVVTAPEDIVQETDAGQNYATVTFAVSATDETDGALTPVVTTSPTTGLTSGSQFPLGTTTVTVSATDSYTNTTTQQFTVTVEDREAPVIQPIGNLTLEADPSGTRTVGFNALVNDNVDTGIVPVFRLSGSVITSPYDFPIGSNVVTIDATDSAGNPAVQEQFTITVTPGTAPNPPLITTADINTNRSMTIGGTAEVDSTVRVTFPDATFQEVTATGGVFGVTSAADMQGGTVRVTATDALGYTSGAATVDLFPDYDEPTVAISGAPSTVTDLTPFTVNIDFSELVLNFIQGDLTVNGASVTSFGGSGANYTAEITPVAGQEITISVAAGVAEDAAGNLNLASAAVQIANTVLTPTEQLVVDSKKSQQRMLINTQPEPDEWYFDPLFGRMMLRINSQNDTGNFDFVTTSGRSVWASGQGQWSTTGLMETAYANFAFGGHYEVYPDVLVGIMAQTDYALSDEGDARMESTGWMVGPYAMARLQSQPIILTGSYLVGQSDNSISPFGTYEDQYGSDRSILTLGVKGSVDLGNILLRPLVDFARVHEETEAYVDGDSNPVGAQTITTTEATIGMDFVLPVPVDSGELYLTGGLGSTLSRVEETFDTEETTRGKANLGFRYMLESGGNLTARATYDGIGDDSYEAFGAQIAFELSF